MTQRVPFKWLSNAGPARHAENCLQEQKAEQAAKLHRKQAWQRLEEAVAGQPASQVRAAIAAAVRAGVPLAWKRKAEARLKLRDSTAAQEVLDCANATPFRTAAYQTALACATQYELYDVCSACAGIVERRKQGTALALSSGSGTAPATVLQGHLKAAGEFELEREAEACRAALAERQTAAAAVLQAAAEQAEALGFSEALALATNAGVNASLLDEATLRFESRLHAAAAAYVHGLHSLPLTTTAAAPAEETLNAAAKSSDKEEGAGQSDGCLTAANVAQLALLGGAVHTATCISISLERLSGFGDSLLAYKCLRELRVASNQLSTISGLEQLSSLKHLDLCDNKLADVSGLASLLQLEYLDLSFNRIERSGSLPTLPSLRWLSVQGNGLTSLAGFPPSGSLTYLSLASNKLTTPEGLQSLCALQDLSLWNNECASLGQLAHLAALTKLNAGQNRLCAMPMTPLLHLQHLTLAHNRIELMPDLSCYPELQTLELQHNMIAGIAAQTGLCTLVALNLSDNRLQSLSALQSLHPFARLTRLDMSDNSLELNPRYLSTRERLLPQLTEEGDGGPVHVSTLEARLSTSLANSAFAPAALLSWQCYGSAHPLRSCCLGLLGCSVRARPLLRRHERLVHMHRTLLKDQAVDTHKARWEQVNGAASRIASAWRAHQCRRHLRQLLLLKQQAKRERAASAIQAAVRRWLAGRSEDDACQAQRDDWDRSLASNLSTAQTDSQPGFSNSAAMLVLDEAAKCLAVEDSAGCMASSDSCSIPMGSLLPARSLDLTMSEHGCRPLVNGKAPVMIVGADAPDAHVDNEEHAGLDLQRLQTLLELHDDWQKQSTYDKQCEVHAAVFAEHASDDTASHEILPENRCVSETVYLQTVTIGSSCNLEQVGPSGEPQGVEAVMADWGFKNRHAAEAFRRARFRKLSSVREQGRLKVLQDPAYRLEKFRKLSHNGDAKGT